jgi:phosphoribosylformimino-5-aminoimidazole carboxamide ribotide isomerase
MRIIVAIDIIDGKCVRLTKGDFSTKKVYDGDPLDLARQVEDNGLRYIHLVDLEGAGGTRMVSFRLLEKIASRTSLKIDFGGGIRSIDTLRTAFNSGASQVTCGSIAVSEKDMFLSWLESWGNEKIILGADCHDRKIVTHGWTESSSVDIIEFVEDYVQQGIKYVICTDIEKDGMLNGPSTDLYKEMMNIKNLNLIASGGISSLKNIEELAEINCDGAIIGKALYEGIFNLNELSRIC